MGVPSRRGLLRKGGSPRSPRSWDSLEPIFLSPARGFWQGDNCTALLSCLLLGYYTVFYVPPEKRDKGRTPISSLLLALQNARYTYRGRRRPHASCGCPARFNELDCEFNMYFE
jgi:hypothetical protein